VVSSLKKLGYTFDFRELLQQETLMRDRLGPYRVDMQGACENPDDVVGQRMPALADYLRLRGERHC
jgi:hypothetical protein